MDENLFFRQAALRICGSLNLQQAMEKTLEYLKQYIPADGMLLGVYDPDLNVGRKLVSIVPEHWPPPPDTIPIPAKYREWMKKRWTSAPEFDVINDIDEEPEESHAGDFPNAVAGLGIDGPYGPGAGFPPSGRHFFWPRPENTDIERSTRGF